MECKTHPDAPHGFLRNASHTEGRYVCECEYWKEDMKTTMEMAKEAGLIVDANQSGFDSVEAFAELVRAEAQAEEREACAKVCDARYMGDNNREDMEAKRCADDIRARGTND